MKHSGEKLLRYELDGINLNELIGGEIHIEFTGTINCVNCSNKIKKTFGDGYCYPCFIKLAACDICILKPELCHYRNGTCREPEWGEKNCLIPHVVYLSNTSGLKVGITREHKRFERWGDQGAIAAIVLAKVPERYVAGLVEVAMKETLADKTDWRALLKGLTKEVDLLSEKKKIIESMPEEFRKFVVEGEENDRIYEFKYPINKYLAKAVTANLDKEAKLAGEFSGIRGQYLFLAEKALNIRKYSGYEIVFKS